MSGVRNYVIVTASYWGFTLTDGALRMLVLLHFYSLGYTPLMLAVAGHSTTSSAAQKL